MTFTRRRLISAAAAAAALAALATSVGVAGGQDALPQPSAHAGPGAAPTRGEGTGWPVVDRDRIDVDGDGVPDRVRLRHRTDRLLPGRVRMEAELSAGGTPSVVLRHGGLTAALLGGADPDSDSDFEVLLYREAGPREVTVIDWDGADGLVVVRHPDRPPLASTYDRQGRARSWWVEDGALRSTRSLQGFVEGGHDVVLPGRYAVTAWAWTMVDGRLEATPLGRQCVRADRPHEPFPCG